MPVRARLPVLVVCLAGLTACAAPPAAEPLAVPADFAVSIAIAGPTAGPDAPPPGSAGRPLDEVTARYVLFCDGSLHWAPGPWDPRTGLPPLRRVLDASQSAGVWSLARQLGLADPANGTDPVDHNVLVAPPDHVVCVAVLRAGGKRWAFRQTRRVGEPLDPALERFIDHLAALAWAAVPLERPPSATWYDFGPDPYARYRR